MHILILSTSPNANGNTLRFCKGLQKILQASKQSVTLIDFSESDIPLPNQGSFNLNQTTSFQKKLLEGLEKATLIFVVTPEYNWMPSPESLNFLNRFASGSTLSLFNNKVFAVAGVSSGRGGRMPAIQLTTAINKIIGFFGLYSVVSGKLFEAQEIPKVMTEEGDLLENEAFNKGVMEFVSYHLGFCAKWG